MIIWKSLSSSSSGKINKHEYLTGEKIQRSNRRQIIEQARFAYCSLGKALEKQTEKQVGALESLIPLYKKDELKQIEGIFQQNLINNLIRVKLKKLVNLQDFIKTDELNCKSKRRKVYDFSEYFLPIVF